MSRSNLRAARSMAAFDFDVVTDAPPPRRHIAPSASAPKPAPTQNAEGMNAEGMGAEVAAGAGNKA